MLLSDMNKNILVLMNSQLFLNLYPLIFVLVLRHKYVQRIRLSCFWLRVYIYLASSFRDFSLLSVCMWWV
jgi:hypothetical protein